MISPILHIPVSCSDDWITSPLYELGVEDEYMMPWLADYSEQHGSRLQRVDLSTFAYMAKARYLQSRILNASKLLLPNHLPEFLSRWEGELNLMTEDDNIFSHR